MRGKLGNVGAEHRHEAPAEQRFDDLADGIDRGAGSRAVELELRVVAQHRAVELLERGARLDAELIDELPPRVVVDLQRLGLPA